ncbi:hypothetical protein DIPPA_14083 [Diplonema papillatum]|nr:hypothetical protein DIPPA_14083 [Diplonema papillatum]
MTKKDRTLEEVLDYAQGVGLDLRQEELLWVAERGVNAPVPDDWVARPWQEGADAPSLGFRREYFVNRTSGSVSYEHPLDKHFRKLAQCFAQPRPATETDPSRLSPPAAGHTAGRVQLASVHAGKGNEPSVEDALSEFAKRFPEESTKRILREFQSQVARHRKKLLDLATKHAALPPVAKPEVSLPGEAHPVDLLPVESHSESARRIALTFGTLAVVHVVVCLVVVYILPYFIVETASPDSL